MVYVFVQYGVSVASLKGLVMALAYCWGLALAIYLMGHGLVAIPRQLFRNATISGKLRRLQARAPTLYERLEDSETTLEEIEMQVMELSRRKTGSAVHFQDWIEDLVDMVNQPDGQPRPAALLAGSGVESRLLPTVITEKYMAELTRQLTRARHSRCRYVNEWDRLVREASETQAILDSAASKKLVFASSSSQASILGRTTLLTPYTRYLLYFYGIPYLELFLGGLLSLASASIVWSELIKAALPNISIVRLTVVHHWKGDTGQVGFIGQIIAALWLLYMCAAALTSVTEVKVWRGRALVRRNTAHESAFWYASQVARLSIPLSYNFITFLSPQVYENTVFYDFLGKLITQTTPGTWFDYLFPIFILVPVCATLFGFYGRVKRLFGFGLDVIDDEEGNPTGYGTASWREGRDLIERELNGTSNRGRRAEAIARNAADRQAGPILSIPREEGRASPSLQGRYTDTRPAASTSARRSAATSSAASAPEPEDDGFFGALGHRIRNTIDTLDKPKWLEDLGQGIKRPPWMGGEDSSSGQSSSRPSGPGRGNSDVRRWFGGSDGRIRL
jgi:hypothetical protein